MKSLSILIIAALLCITACNKDADTTGPVNREAHTFTGTVTGCASGKPLRGVRLELTATNTGFLFGGREVVGSAVTDSLGRYIIAGRYIEDFAIKTYSLRITMPGTDAEDVELLEYDALPSPRLAYIYNIRLVTYATLLYKINRQNTADTHKVLVRTYQEEMECQPRYSGMSINMQSVYGWQNSGEKVYRTVRGDDTVYIGKSIITATDTTAEELTTRYLNTGDTAVINITY